MDERSSHAPATASAGRNLALSLGGVGVVILAAIVAASIDSCATTNRTLVAPPAIAGATFIGSDACGDCHTDIAAHFDSATHARLRAEGNNAAEVGCESCHGPGSLHAESGGEAKNIINPAKSPEICFNCHLNKRGDFALPHSHPLTGGPLGLVSGRVSCSDCHEPHSGPAVIGGGIQAAAENDTCVGCHPAQRGPWVFEHEALREGCTVCHAPHGSVNDKMLTERDANLCLKCHFQEQTNPATVVIGGRDHTAFLSRGTCFSAGCHEAVHGSNVSSSLRF